MLHSPLKSRLVAVEGCCCCLLSACPGQTAQQVRTRPHHPPSGHLLHCTSYFPLCKPPTSFFFLLSLHVVRKSAEAADGSHSSHRTSPRGLLLILCSPSVFDNKLAQSRICMRSHFTSLSRGMAKTGASSRRVQEKWYHYTFL